MRVFLDASVLFSAAKSDGAVRELLRMLKAARWELWADAYVIEEARRNLAAKGAGGLDYLAGLLESLSLAPLAQGSARRLSAKLPEKDRPVIEAAIRSGCDFLVTGDRTHFGPLYGTRIEGVEIIAPAALAMRLMR